MTDEEIRTIFEELRRIGADPGRPPGLALGTGFGPGELIPWLRALPDNVGHDAFAERLKTHVESAAPIATPPPAEDSRPNGTEPTFSFSHPTLEQLEAATDVLVREWDPLGARLGELPREVAAQTAFDALNGIVANRGSRRLEQRIAKHLATVEEREFGVRPSPPEQRRYLARRLIQVADEHPAPVRRIDYREMASKATGRATTSAVALGPRGDEPPALDPNAACTECGAVGTVAFVTREIEPLVSRYCAPCWRRVRHKYWGLRMPKVDKETPAGLIALLDYMDEMAAERQLSVGSALWEDRIEFVKAALDSQPDESDPDGAKRRAHFRHLAREIVNHAAEMQGPMPPEFEAFVREYGGPDA